MMILICLEVFFFSRQAGSILHVRCLSATIFGTVDSLNMNMTQ